MCKQESHIESKCANFVDAKINTQKCNLGNFGQEIPLGNLWDPAMGLIFISGVVWSSVLQCGERQTFKKKVEMSKYC